VNERPKMAKKSPQIVPVPGDRYEVTPGCKFHNEAVVLQPEDVVAIRASGLFGAEVRVNGADVVIIGWSDLHPGNLTKLR
jgi:hypothetical protein